MVFVINTGLLFKDKDCLFRFVQIVLNVPPIFFGGPARTFFSVVFFSVLEELVMGKSLFWRCVLSVDIHQFGTNPTFRQVQYRKLVIDLVFPDYQFIHRINFPSRLHIMAINLYLPLFAGIGGHIPSFKITNAPKVFINAHQLCKSYVKQLSKIMENRILRAYIKLLFMKKYSIALLFVFFLMACGNNDNGTGIIAVEPRRLSEVAPEDDAAIQEYLATHFYNYEDFRNPPANFDFRIVISEIDEDNSDKWSLLDMLNTGEVGQLKDTIIPVSDTTFGLDFGEENVPHTLYYLEAQMGTGRQVGVADSTFVTFEGSLLDGEIFQSQLGGGAWLDLEGSASINNPGVVTGFQEGMQNFSAGSGVTDFPDGTFEINGVGAGLIIMPSGLGFFNSNTAVAAFSPLIFNLNILFTKPADHDNDGLISELENRDNDPSFLSDDTDGDGIPDYIDFDDDGDGTLTQDEILLEGEDELQFDANGNPIFPDGDGDGIPDHLDPDTN